MFRFHLLLRLALHLGAQRLEPGLVYFVSLDASFIFRSGQNHLFIRFTFLGGFRSPCGERIMERVRPGLGDSLVEGFGFLGRDEAEVLTSRFLGYLLSHQVGDFSNGRFRLQFVHDIGQTDVREFRVD
jgi:hypothetical protein